MGANDVRPACLTSQEVWDKALAEFKAKHGENWRDVGPEKAFPEFVAMTTCGLNPAWLQNKVHCLFSEDQQ